MRRMMSAALFVAAVLVAPQSFGQSNFCGPKQQGGTTLYPTVDFGSLPVLTNLPNGSVIVQRNLNMDDMVCYRTDATFKTMMQGVQTSYPNVYTTNVTRVGVRVALGRTQKYAPYEEFYRGSWDGQLIVQSPFQVELIKLGPIHAGDSLSGLFYEGNVKGRLGEARSTATFTGGTFRNISCATQNVTVSLPTVGLSAFARQPAAGRTPFAISIHCTSSEVLKGIDYQFSSTTSVVDSALGVIALDGAGTSAKGVGIQIMDQQNTPIQFQHRYTLAGFTPGQPLYRIPLIAAYYRTGVVQAGTVHSSMEFTLSYK